MNEAFERTRFLRKGKYGFFYHFHYREQWLEPENPRLADEYYALCRNWDAVVDGFDVEKTAAMLHRWNAGFFYLTIGQNAGYYCAPNSVYDGICRKLGFESRCSKRDLISDLADALKKYEIPLIVYTTSNPPNRFTEFCKELHFSRHDPDRTFIDAWTAIHREWAERWGTKISGWWVDGAASSYMNYISNDPADDRLTKFNAALRAGNPMAAVAYNDWLQEEKYEADYTAREFNRGNWVSFRFVRGPMNENNQQYHQLAYIGRDWCRMPVVADPATMVNATRAVTDNSGAIGWDLPIYTDGRIAEDAEKTVDEFVRLYQRSFLDVPSFKVDLPQLPAIGPKGERLPGILNVESERPVPVMLVWNGQKYTSPASLHHCFTLPALMPEERHCESRTFSCWLENQWGSGNAYLQCGQVRKYFMPEVRYELELDHFPLTVKKEEDTLARLTLDLERDVLSISGTVFDEEPQVGSPAWSGCGIELFFAKPDARMNHEAQLCFRPDGKVFQVIVKEFMMIRKSVAEDYPQEKCVWKMEPVKPGEWSVMLELPLAGFPWYRSGEPFRFDLQLSVTRRGKIVRSECFGREIRGDTYAGILNVK